VIPFLHQQCIRRHLSHTCHVHYGLGSSAIYCTEQQCCKQHQDLPAASLPHLFLAYSHAITNITHLDNQHTAITDACRATSRHLPTCCAPTTAQVVGCCSMQTRAALQQQQQQRGAPWGLREMGCLGAAAVKLVQPV
jgi:hypothetical protein